MTTTTIVKVDPSFKQVEPRWSYDPNKLFEIMAITRDGVDLLPEYALVIVRVPMKYLIAWDTRQDDDTERIELMFNCIDEDT